MSTITYTYYLAPQFLMSLLHFLCLKSGTVNNDIILRSAQFRAFRQKYAVYYDFILNLYFSHTQVANTYLHVQFYSNIWNLKLLWKISTLRGIRPLGAWNYIRFR